MTGAAVRERLLSGTRLDSHSRPQAAGRAELQIEATACR